MGHVHAWRAVLLVLAPGQWLPGCPREFSDACVHVRYVVWRFLQLQCSKFYMFLFSHVSSTLIHVSDNSHTQLFWTRDGHDTRRARVRYTHGGALPRLRAV